ncbi:ferredoxin [Metallosphaera javensis (ex Sakai et al. 2022)]|uniref:ferredoxin n=1 Tax=Metallosphaera javensis (ex Sakai et al. 2022) TaxID=2775498 RepID=UPI00258E479A|nr:MAG: (2Fe-2S)-binding protein [Metallosphaera javensis (ex Sakai et al. 2022)]
MEVRSKRHGRIRAPFDCEKGLPYTEVNLNGKLVENCEPVTGLKGFSLPFSGMYLHRVKFIRHVPWLLEKIAERMNVPERYSALEEYAEERINVDTLIIGSGLSGLTALSRSKGILVTNDLFTDLFDDPLHQGELVSKIKEVIKQNESRIIQGDFMGKFTEGFVVRAGKKLLLISPSKVIFAVGGRYLPPIFEGNDYPNVISRRLYLKRRSIYSKVVVLGSSDDAIKTALVAGAKILIPREVRLFSRRYLELAETKGVEIDEVNFLRVKPKDSKLSVEWDRGNQLVDAVVFAPVKQPRIESMANAGCEYRFYPNMGIYLPEHEMDGYMRSCGHFVVGGARGIWDDEASMLSGEAPFNPEALSFLSYHLKEMPLHEYYTRNFVSVRSPYYYSPGGYACFCEDVLWSDVEQVTKMGYDNVELAKRVGGIGLGECQGKVCTYVTGSVLSSQKLITFRSPLYPM